MVLDGFGDISSTFSCPRKKNTVFGENHSRSSLEAAGYNGKHYQAFPGVYQVLLHIHRRPPPPHPILTPLVSLADKNRRRLRAFHVVGGQGWARRG